MLSGARWNQPRKFRSWSERSGADGKARKKPIAKSPPLKELLAAHRNELLAAAQEPDRSEAERRKILRAARRAGEEEKQQAQFVTARWRRDDDAPTIAKAILGTLKYEPHARDIDPLRRALERFIAPQDGASGGAVKAATDRAEMRAADRRAPS